MAVKNPRRALRFAVSTLLLGAVAGGCGDDEEIIYTNPGPMESHGGGEAEEEPEEDIEVVAPNPIWTEVGPLVEETQTVDERGATEAESAPSTAD